MTALRIEVRHRDEVEPAPAEADLPAGAFSAWWGAMQGVLRGERAADVPCNGCTACCTGSQFVPIGPEEVETLAHIPAALLFPAPRRPEGHVVLGYDDKGRCPMLADDRCSIYEHRPRACRTYDCRVLTATGLDVGSDGGDKALIARRAGRWRFSYPTRRDRVERDAVRAAASYLTAHPHLLQNTAAPVTTTALAVLALHISGLFLIGDPSTGLPGITEPDPETVEAAVRRHTAPKSQWLD